MSKTVVAFDIHGVLLDFVGPFISMGKSMGLPMPPHRDEWFAHMPIPQRVFNDVWNEIKDSPEWWARLPSIAKPQRDASSVDYYITTTPDAVAQAQHDSMVARGFQDVPLFITRDADDKARVAKSLGVTHAIDDDILNWHAYREAGIDCYLMRQPWNANERRLLWHSADSFVSDLSTFNFRMHQLKNHSHK